MMKTQQRVTMQPVFGTRILVRPKTHIKLLANVEKYALDHKWEKTPTKEEAVRNMKSLYKAIFEHNSNPVNHILDNSTVEIKNVEVDKRCTSTIYNIETDQGDHFMLNQGERYAHGVLQNIQNKAIDAKNMTPSEKAEKFLAKIQPNQNESSPSYLRRIYNAIVNKQAKA